MVRIMLSILYAAPASTTDSPPWPDEMTAIGTAILAGLTFCALVATMYLAARDRKAAEGREKVAAANLRAERVFAWEQLLWERRSALYVKLLVKNDASLNRRTNGIPETLRADLDYEAIQRQEAPGPASLGFEAEAERDALYAEVEAFASPAVQEQWRKCIQADQELCDFAGYLPSIAPIDAEEALNSSKEMAELKEVRTLLTALVRVELNTLPALAEMATSPARQRWFMHHRT